MIDSKVKVISTGFFCFGVLFIIGKTHSFIKIPSNYGEHCDMMICNMTPVVQWVWSIHESKILS